LRQKGVFPYDYYNNEESLKNELPSLKEFYNKLNNSNISEEDYIRATKVYNLNNCKNLKDYLDLYLKTDVLLLADSFENFRNTCMKFYGLDPVHYFTAPGFSWDAMLLGYYRKNKVNNYEYNYELGYDLKIESFKETQEDMLEMIKNSMRGGISIITHRYSKANNKYMKNYNPNEENKYDIYLDANNLYGWAMSQYMPVGSYKWDNEMTLEKILETPDENDKGYILEVDIEIPNELHDYFNDYPLAVENTIFEPSPYMSEIAKTLDIKQSKVKKLIPNLFNKTKYITHYRNLKLYQELGLKITKIHRVLSFEQQPYLEDYIMFNTNMRAQTKLDYEKDLFKLLNNSIFGKTMENVEKRIEVKLITNERKFLKQVCKPNYKGHKIFSNDLVAVNMNKTEIFYNKPVIVGFSILELSKLHMYNFHYNVMKKKYNENIKLLFTDTDSLCYQIKTEDLYKDMKEMEDLFDFSEYPKNHLCYNEKNKKVIGKFKCETNGIPITEFVGIRSKMYRFTVDDGKEKGTAKGIKKTVAKKIDIEQYKKCLFSKDKNDMKTTVKFNLIRSNNHILKSVEISKTGLSCYDDKRYYLDTVNSYAYGHYKSLNNN